MSKAHVIKSLHLLGPGDLIVGIDPDLHTSALCWWKVGDPWPLALGVVRVPKEIRGQDVVSHLQEHGVLRFANFGLVEGQRHRRARGHETKNPQSLTDLAVVTGFFAGYMDFGLTGVIEPSEWKGSVPKDKHQARVLLKIPGTKIKKTKAYAYPVAGPLLRLAEKGGLKRTDWKHVADAVGIAQWAVNKVMELNKRARWWEGRIA